MKRTQWTAKKREQFLAVLSEIGNVTGAAKAVGVSRSRAYELREEEEEFAALWDQAEKEATDLLEKEAHRRAVEGVLKPIYHQGRKVGTIREYSDTLLIFLLKGNKPEKFRERFEHSGPGGKPIELVQVYLPGNGR